MLYPLYYFSNGATTVTEEEEEEVDSTGIHRYNQ